jgi:uncharacterized protein YecE (DUF72 family)
VRGTRRIYIGTSGWHYDHWKGPFYPSDLPQERFLTYYQERFRSVEINSSFYRLPTGSSLAGWRDATPPSFCFAVKASRFITHMKKLKDTKRPLSAFLQQMRVLEGKLGPILFQLPPRWNLNLERLREFLKILPRDHRFAFEFRDPRWFTKEVYDALAESGAAFCIYQFAGLLSPVTITADFVYLRLHGPSSEAYRGRYSTQVLAGWAGRMISWMREGKGVSCYFDNDEAGYAARNAEELQEMIAGTSASRKKGHAV